MGQQSTAIPMVLDADQLFNLFAKTRAASVALAAPLSDAEATIQSMPDASPAKWHLAHTTWFLETFVLRDSVEGYQPFDPRYAYLFNSYYDAEGDRHSRPHRGMLARPSLEDVLAYRAHVDAAVSAAWSTLSQRARNLIELGCHHEAQHQELLLTDILHAFSQNPLEPAFWPASQLRPASLPQALCWVDGPQGRVDIGHDGQGFAFDCETPRHSVWLAPHAIANRLVTISEWQLFLDDGGYRRPELWLSDGWAWITANRVDAPLYWRDKDGFGLSGRHPRHPAAPVAHVSFYEAEAYARWAGARLPTEFEWEASAPNTALAGMFGDVWQWTASAFLPYPGFSVTDGAVGEYNGKFMSGQMVLRGSSDATPSGTSRITTRNFFPPHTRWQFAGLRLARDL